MVKKIVGNFDTEKFDKILLNLGKNFDFLFYGDALFLALRDWKNRDFEETEIKKYLRPARNYVVKELDKDSVGHENQVAQEWCTNKFVALERQRYEEEQQEKL